MKDLINLHRAAIYTKPELQHQEKAWQYLQSVLTEDEILKFADLFRTQPTEAPKSIPAVRKRSTAYNYPLIYLSQRDNKQAWDGKGVSDAAQTCFPTSVTMVVRAYTGKLISVKDIDYVMRVKYGNRYSHDNGVKCLRDFGIKSVFSTSTPLDRVKSHLQTGNLVIMSWLVTHSGHIVVLADYKDGKFLIYDPWGEPSIGTNNKPVYKDVRKPYWVSEAAIRRYSANTSTHIWAHLVSKS